MQQLLIILFIGSISWVLTMFKSGLSYSFGMGFWGANGHDGIWHIALINTLSKFSLAMPVFAGEKIKNYHLGFGILTALIHKITFIPVSTLYFQILPIIFAVFIGLLTYKFVVLWRNSVKEALVSMFFVYFSGSFGFLITLLRNEGIWGESMFWSQQSLSTLINPPYALSLIFILAGLIFLIKYLKENKFKFFILSAIFFGLLIQIKVYAGILSLAGLGTAGIWKLVRSKDWKVIKVFLLSLAISVVLFLPFIKDSSGLLVFQPFWFLETMMGSLDRLNWGYFYSAMSTFKSGGMIIKAIIFYSIAFIVFLVGNSGLRILGFGEIVTWLKKPLKIGEIECFILTLLFFAIVIPMFFLQKGTPWNTIQFFYYFLFFFSILAAITFTKIISKSSLVLKYAVVILLGIFTLGMGYSTLRNYLPARPPAKLSKAEIEALNFLSKEPDGVILTYSYDPIKAKEAQSNPPRPLYLYESTAYVSAFSRKEVFLEDEVNLDITGYDWKTRREKETEFYLSLDSTKSREFLKENNISYIYWLKPQRAKLGDKQLGLTRIFENSEAEIYKVN